MKQHPEYIYLINSMNKMVFLFYSMKNIITIRCIYYNEDYSNLLFLFCQTSILFLLGVLTKFMHATVYRYTLHVHECTPIYIHTQEILYRMLVCMHTNDYIQHLGSVQRVRCTDANEGSSPWQMPVEASIQGRSHWTCEFEIPGSERIFSDENILRVYEIQPIKQLTV